MTTRRGFIQGVLVAIGAAVMPKVAVAEAPSVNHRMLHAIDELMDAESAILYGDGTGEALPAISYKIDPDFDPYQCLREQRERLAPEWACEERGIIFARPVPLSVIDAYTDQGFIVLVSPE